MATATKKKREINRTNIKKEYSRLHDKVINVSEETVEVTVDNIEKWQKLFAKSITASTPLVEKGIDLTFTVAETLLDQYKNGGQRMKSLLGLGQIEKRSIKKIDKTIAKVTSKVTKTAKKVENVTEKIKSEAKKVKAANIKMPSKISEIKGIGPKIEGLLKEAGIQSMEDLAKANIETVQNVLDKAGSRFKMHNPSTWIDQAKTFIIK